MKQNTEKYKLAKKIYLICITIFSFIILFFSIKIIKLKKAIREKEKIYKKELIEKINLVNEYENKIADFHKKNPNYERPPSDFDLNSNELYVRQFKDIGTIYFHELYFRRKDFFQCYDKVNNINRCVIYTCASNNYDKIFDLTYKTPGFDFVAWVDDLNFKTSKPTSWHIYKIPGNLNYLGNIRKCKYMKVNAHEFLQVYNVSIYIDANLDIIKNMTELLDLFLENNTSIYAFTHPFNNDTYSEIKLEKMLKHDTDSNLDRMNSYFKKKRFPKFYGLVDTRVLMRKHNEKDCIAFMKKWWEFIDKYSHRDYLSFNFIQWKLKAKVKYLINTTQLSPYIENSYSHYKPHSKF